MPDVPQRHRIDVACPECGHVQPEPALVISTQCRSCRANFQVRDGKGVSRIRPATRIADPNKSSISLREDPLKAISGLSTPGRPKELLREIKELAHPSLIARLIFRAKPPREVICFDCGHHHRTVHEAQSTQCPKCGSYISLTDYEITEPWNKRIETGGNVIIQKTGVVSGITIRCHNLTVLGELAGSVDCSGDLIIRSHGRIIGKVRCRSLRVEKGARVEFLHPVTAGTAFIDGTVRGQIACTGSVTLQKRAHLQGLVRTTSLVIKPGAKHTGSIEMISSAPSNQPNTEPQTHASRRPRPQG